MGPSGMNRLSAHFLFIPRYTAGSVEYGSLQLSDLNILGTLGVGAFGKVYLVSWLNVLSVEVTMNWADSSNLTGIRLRGEGNFFNLNQKVDKSCCLFGQIEEYTELCQHQYCTLNVRFYLVSVYKSANWFKWLLFWLVSREPLLSEPGIADFNYVFLNFWQALIFL